MTYATGDTPVTWPVPGSAVVELGSASSLRSTAPAAPGGLVKAGSLPVRLGTAASTSAAAAPADDEKGLRSAAATAPSQVLAEIVDRSKVSQVVSSGTGLRVTRADGGTTPGRVRVELDYSGFSEAFGGNYGSRLVLVQLPACVLVTPERRECQTQTPVQGATNNAVAKTVSADVDAAPVDTAEPQARSMAAAASVGASAPVFALASAPGGPAGDFSKSSLGESSSWTAGDSGGGFSWSYPLKTPQAPAGPQPALSLSYSSAAIDGMTNATSAQGSPIGAGWDLSTGFVERSFVSCAEDGTATGDLCFSGEYYTMSLGGKSGALVKDGTSGTWHMDGDPGWKIDHLNDYTGSMFNGGQWKVTTADGTQYFFGRRVRFAGDAGTSSEQSVPVIGNHPGEPCYTSPDIKASTCWQNYKWNLDYVIDPAGNSMSYFYTQEWQKYGMWNNQSAATFHRGALLHHIEYGTRAGSEGSGPAPYRIEFPTLWRCKQPGNPAQCGPNDQPNFPDVPWDQFCDVSLSSCPSVLSPSFWILNKISAMETKVYDPISSTYKKLDRYDFPSGFPTVSDNSSPSLWLESVTHTGYDSDGTALATPPVNFYGVQKNNRADHNVSTGSLPMVHYRVDRISSETGAVTTVSYSGEDCAAASPMPDPDMNTKRCFPQYWKPVGSPAGWAWWQKYVATQVTVTDSLGVSPVETWSYAYSNDNSVPAPGKPAVLWGHNNGFMTPLPQRSWSDWYGYSQVVTTHGVANQQPQTTVRRYYRGLHGDRTDAGWGTRTMNVVNSEGTNGPDWENLRGHLWEEYSLVNGVADQVTVHDLQGWVLSNIATGEKPRIASAIREVGTQTRTRIQRTNPPISRIIRTTTEYDAELFPAKVIDRGDLSTSGDDVCTLTTYNRNLTTHILSTISQTETFACPGGTIPNGAQPLSGSQTYYDGAADVTGLATAPTKGQPTRAKSLSANTPGYATVGLTEYDTLGRVLKVTDAMGRSATSAYTPAAAGAPTQVVTTTPPPSGTGVGFATTTTINRHTGLPVRQVDANGKTTEAYYDSLGRVVSVWGPGRVRGIHSASVNYSYSISKTALPFIATSALGPDNNDRIVSYEILDSRFRPRQTQTVTQTGDRRVIDTAYDTAGRVVKTSSLGVTGAPSATLQAVSDANVATQHRFTYDDLGRQTVDELWGLGVKHSQTATAYDGDSVTVTPPTGGTATTTFTNAKGKPSTLRQFLGSAPSGSFQDTTYGYDLLSRQTSATTAGSTWTSDYDVRGQVKRKVDPDNGITTMKYYEDGQLEYTVDAESRKVAMKYDGMGRRTGMYVDNIGGTQLASWVYDTLAKGQLTSSSRHVGSEAYTTAVTAYDSGYRPLGTSITIPDSVGTTLKGVYTTTLTYKDNGAPATVTYPAAGTMAAETLTYAYNTAGQQTSITSPLDTYLAEVIYDYDGVVLQSVHGKGDKRVKVSTPRQAVTGLMAAAQVDTEKVSAPGGWEEQYTEKYAYDLAGNVLGINETKANTTISNQCFGYDGLRRMTQSWTTAATTCQSTPSTGVLGGADPYWTSYEFDTAGNRSKELKHAAPGGGLGTDTERTYTTPGAGQPKTHSLTKVDTKVGSSPATTTDTLTYDNTGNTATHNNATYTWNVLGKLSKVAISGGATTDFVYDADGNRVLRKDSTGTTTYLGNTEMHANTPVSSPTVTRTYPGAVRTTDGGLVWMLADHHGTSQTSIKATDLTVTRRRTDPYGGPRGTAVAWPTQRGFVDGVNDPDTGLTHIGARDYSPTTGRFISIDPVFDGTDPQSWNGYAYANNAPATSSDPTGTQRRQDDGGGGCAYPCKDPNPPSGVGGGSTPQSCGDPGFNGPCKPECQKLGLCGKPCNFWDRSGCGPQTKYPPVSSGPPANKDIDANYLADQFFAGKGGEYEFSDGDLFAERLKLDPYLMRVRQQIAIQVARGVTFGEDDLSKSLGDLRNVPDAAKDLIIILASRVGLDLGNLEVAFIGSYELDWKLASDGGVDLTITNTTTVQSLTRTPGIGYMSSYETSGRKWESFANPFITAKNAYASFSGLPAQKQVIKIHFPALTSLSRN